MDSIKLDHGTIHHMDGLDTLIIITPTDMQAWVMACYSEILLNWQSLQYYHMYWYHTSYGEVEFSDSWYITASVLRIVFQQYPKQT